jgi:hypothetical protein
MMARPMWLPVLVCAGLVGGACDAGEFTPAAPGAEGPLVQRVLPDEPGALASVPAELAYDRSGPGGLPFEVTLRTRGQPGHDRRFGALALPVAIRTEGLESYPCTSCHIPGQAAVPPDRAADAHQNIQPVHPAETGATCATCHIPVQVDRLVLPGGATASLDQPYRLCAACHYAAVDDWAAGVHGKRLDGWYGRRIVMNCTECHDPHRPSLDQRTPFPGPVLPRRR